MDPLRRFAVKVRFKHLTPENLKIILDAMQEKVDLSPFLPECCERVPLP